MTARPVALRAALIWRDEVMSDVVADVPRRITIGHQGKTTFTVPDVGLPANFAIISPGNRGYLLTLGEHMRGTICIEGREQDVREFVARGGGSGPGGFHATPISGRDWGVIDLDESGDYKLFFQFVPVDAPIASNAELFSTLAVTGGIVALALIALVVTGAELPSLSLSGIGEWSFRSMGLIICGLVIFGLAFRLATTDPESQASTGFSIVLHGSLLAWTYIVYIPHVDEDVWPGPRALTGNYLVSRLEPELEVITPPATGKQAQEEAPAAQSPTRPKLKTATKGDKGAAGGKGETERARDPNAEDTPPEPPKVALLDRRNAAILDNIIDRNLATNLGKFTGIRGDTLRAGSIGFGPGSGTGVGEGRGTGTTRGGKGKGPGGGGQVEGDFVSTKGPVKMGKERPGGKCRGAGCTGSGPREVKVSVGRMSGDPGGYTEEEINRVVKSRRGVFRACYQKELNRSPGIGGKIVVKFKIGRDGMVQKASVTSSSSLTNARVRSCVQSNVMRLRFPAKGAIANVTYPFLFSPGG